MQILKKKGGPILAGIALIVIVAAIGVTTKLIQKYIPTDEKVDAKTYYGIEKEEELALVLQDEVVEQKGRVIDGVAYIDYEVVKNYLNKRFYWDSNENVLIYTTPTEQISVDVGSKEYMVSKGKNSTDYVILKADGDKTYIAADFIQQYTNMEYQFLENPNRLVIDYKWGVQQHADTKKQTDVRLKGGVKSPIITTLKKGDQVTVLEVMDQWSKIATTDGFVGYVTKKSLSSIKEEDTKREFQEPVYTSLTKNNKINMAWHLVTHKDANNEILSLLSSTKGLNTIAPTWFVLSDNNGSVASLADSNYVTQAHQQNIEVWGVVRDFDGENDIKLNEVLSYTSKREGLSNQLLALAIQYELDGINIDFETVGKGLEGEEANKAGENYIQFIRELSIKCRKNGIILSIDDPVPMSFNTFYDRQEQGIVADYVINMGYDEHYEGSDSGPVASLPFVKNSIEETLKEVPANKLINGIPFYTRLWTESNGDNGTKTTSIAIGMNRADSILSDNKVEKTWDEEMGCYYAEYETSEGTNKIWLEEEDSINEKMKLIQENNLAGVAQWRIGFERPRIWDIILPYIN